MSAPTLSGIIDGLADTLRPLGLRVYEQPPSKADPPAAVIIPPDIDYRQAMRAGVVALEFEVIVLVPAVADRQQAKLRDWLDWVGPKSILAAIDADKTLGVPNVDANVFSSRPLGLEEVALYQFFGASLTVRVVVTNRE